jgi:hypothetical protein
MNRNIYNLLFTLLTLIILCCLFSESKYTETFVPKILKEKYRPLERNIRMTYEGFYNKTTTGVSNLFRKFGIL